MPRAKPLRGRNTIATAVNTGKIKPALCQVANTRRLAVLPSQSALTGGAIVSLMISMDWIMVAMIAATAAIAVYCSVTGCGMDTYENYYGDDK